MDKVTEKELLQLKYILENLGEVMYIKAFYKAKDPMDKMLLRANFNNATKRFKSINRAYRRGNLNKDFTIAKRRRSFEDVLSDIKDDTDTNTKVVDIKNMTIDAIKGEGK